MKKFSKTLAKVLGESKELREIIKNEALKNQSFVRIHKSCSFKQWKYFRKFDTRAFRKRI